MSAAGAVDRLHVRVEGVVQGVGFRWFVRERAAGLGLGGWVRNLADGAVVVLAVGSRPALEALRRELEQGPPGAHVARLVDLPGGDETPGRDFEIRRDPR